LSNSQTAEAVAEQTGEKMLLLHSYHNLSKKEFEKGVTYLDLMRQNAENLKIGLGGE
jgi:zinc transport system substrate-binding protein